MPLNLSSNLKTVIDQFTPDVLGAFWITDEKLSRDLLGLDEFNYLFDGLISQYLYGQKTEEKKDLSHSNIFFTSNFGQKIFLSHIKNASDTKNILDEQMALFLKNDERKKILVYNTSAKDWISELKKNYPKTEFQALELSSLGK